MFLSKRPCRLTMRLPNANAKDLFFGVKNEILEEMTKCQRFRCLGCCSITGIILFSIIIFDNARGAILGLFGCMSVGILFYFVKQDSVPNFKTDVEGYSMARVLMTQNLEDRVEKGVENYQSCLKNLEHAPQVSAASTLNVFVDNVFPEYENMNIAGCIPKSIVATYGLAWTVLLGHYQNGSSMHHPSFSHINDLHQKWVNLIVKQARAAVSIVGGLDNTRAQARRRAQSQAMGAVTDLIGILDVAETYQNIRDITADLKEIRQTMENTEVVSSGSFTPRTELHDINRLRARNFIVTYTVLIVPCIIAFVAVGSPLAAGMMGGVYVLLIAVTIWMNSRVGNSNNALEDLYDTELYLRKLIKLEVEKNPISGQEQLGIATNVLRDLVMDAYYDSLAIHLQTEMLTFGNIPSSADEPHPLFWPAKVTAMTNNNTGGNTQTVP